VHKQNDMSHMWQSLLTAGKDEGAALKKGELARGIVVGRSSDGWYQVLLVEVKSPADGHARLHQPSRHYPFPAVVLQNSRPHRPGV
jgi:hypothetical protein